MEGMNTNILDLKVSNDFFMSSKNIDVKKESEKVNRNFYSCFEEAKSIIENKNTAKENSMINSKKDKIDEEIDSELDSLKNILLVDISLFLKELETKIDSHGLKKIGEKIIPILENIPKQIAREIIGKEIFYCHISNNNETINKILNQISEITELLNTLEKKLDKNLLSTTEKGTLIINEIKDNISLIKKEIEPVKEKMDFIENNVRSKVDLDGKDFSNSIDLFDEFKNETEYELKEAEVENSLKANIKPENIDSEEVHMRPIFINSEKDLVFENKIESMEKRPVEISKEELIKQIVEKANIMLDGDSSEIRIKLKPEVLGELLLKVEVEKGIVVAKAIVDNYRAKELIEANLLQLKEGLEEQGLDIKTFQVQVGNNSDFDREKREEFFQNNRKNKKIKSKKESILNINNYEENIMSDNSISLNEGTLDLKA